MRVREIVEVTPNITEVVHCYLNGRDLREPLSLYKGNLKCAFCCFIFGRFTCLSNGKYGQTHFIPKIFQQYISPSREHSEYGDDQSVHNFVCISTEPLAKMLYKT